jgi:predicted RNase H-like nuclease (RuvC/YqgF family)
MLEALTSRVWVLHDRRVTDFPGSFSEWEDQSREREHAASVAASEQEALRRVRERKTTRRHDEQADQERGALRDARRTVIECEETVTELEKKVSELSSLLEDPELYTTREGTERSLRLGKDLEKARRRLDTALEKWSAATERMQELSGV